MGCWALNLMEAYFSDFSHPQRTFFLPQLEEISPYPLNCLEHGPVVTDTGNFALWTDFHLPFRPGQWPQPSWKCSSRGNIAWPSDSPRWACPSSAVLLILVSPWPASHITGLSNITCPSPGANWAAPHRKMPWDSPVPRAPADAACSSFPPACMWDA